jgi:hypothetical protein
MMRAFGLVLCASLLLTLVSAIDPFQTDDVTRLTASQFKEAVSSKLCILLLCHMGVTNSVVQAPWKKSMRMRRQHLSDAL